MLLNLQSLTEKIGSECEGKIWVICTGQEAIDEIIKFVPMSSHVSKHVSKQD